MTGFDDLLELASANGGFVHTEARAEVAGTLWEWGYNCLDGAGDPVDMRLGFTGAYLINDMTGSLVASVPVLFPVRGVVKCRATDSYTHDVQTGSHHQVCTITRDSDGASLRLIAGGGLSTFVVLQGGL